MSIHDPGAWSAHAQDYDGAFTGTILSSALPNHLFPHLDAALESASAGQRIGLLASACGPGTELHIILARYGKGGEKQHLGGRLKVLATDFAENMVKRVEGEVKNGGLAGTVEVECKVMDSMALALPDSSIDFALLCFGPMLLPDGQQGLRELSRVLSPQRVRLRNHHRSSRPLRRAGRDQAFGLPLPLPTGHVQTDILVRPTVHARLVRSLLRPNPDADSGVRANGRRTSEGLDAHRSVSASDQSIEHNPGMASTMGDIREEERPLFGKLRRELLQSYAEKGKLELITTANVAWAWK